MLHRTIWPTILFTLLLVTPWQEALANDPKLQSSGGEPPSREQILQQILQQQMALQEKIKFINNNDEILQRLKKAAEQMVAEQFHGEAFEAQMASFDRPAAIALIQEVAPIYEAMLPTGGILLSEENRTTLRSIHYELRRPKDPAAKIARLRAIAASRCNDDKMTLGEDCTDLPVNIVLVEDPMLRSAHLGGILGYEKLASLENFPSTICPALPSDIGLAKQLHKNRRKCIGDTESFSLARWSKKRFFFGTDHFAEPNIGIWSTSSNSALNQKISEWWQMYAMVTTYGSDAYFAFRQADQTIDGINPLNDLSVIERKAFQLLLGPQPADDGIAAALEVLLMAGYWADRLEKLLLENGGPSALRAKLRSTYLTNDNQAAAAPIDQIIQTVDIARMVSHLRQIQEKADAFVKANPQASKYVIRYANPANYLSVLAELHGLDPLSGGPEALHSLDQLLEELEVFVLEQK